MAIQMRILLKSVPHHGCRTTPSSTWWFTWKSNTPLHSTTNWGAMLHKWVEPRFQPFIKEVKSQSSVLISSHKKLQCFLKSIPDEGSTKIHRNTWQYRWESKKSVLWNHRLGRTTTGVEPQFQPLKKEVSSRVLYSFPVTRTCNIFY